MADYRLVLFDLDGTLTDPKDGITKSVSYALTKLGIAAPSPDELTPFIGPPLHETFEPRYGLGSTAVSDAVAYYREYFSARGLYENQLYEGVPQLLTQLRGRSHLVVATSKPAVFAEQILDHFRIRAFFDHVVGSCLDGTQSDKTDVVARALGKYPGIRNAVMVGDRVHDVVGARANAIDSIGVAYGYGSLAELNAARPTYIAATVEDIGRILSSGH